MNIHAAVVRTPGAVIWFTVLAVLLTGACTMKPAMLTIEGFDHPLAEESILDTATGETVTFEQLIDRLAGVRVVYVGERHSSPRHHQVQLEVIRALKARDLAVSVGMEMFDHSYQDRLDRWSAGELEWDDFLKQTHWYANWRFNDKLYKQILLYIKEQKLPLIGLNIPFHLPRKIAIGGLGSLLDDERALLPDEIDTTHTEHRAYVEEIFKMHNIKGRSNFEFFYEAQCAWEDGMAKNLSDHLGPGVTVALAGNGHIVKKFGIPVRAHKRTGADFLTVYLATPDDEVSREDGDFIWVAPHMPPAKPK